MRQKYGTSLQLWPSGKSIEYRGDPNGPRPQLRVRVGHVSERKARRWRMASAQEQHDIKIEVRAEMYRDQYIWSCDSSLVGDLLQHGGQCNGLQGWGMDDIENMYRDPSDWDAAQCREYASDHGLDLPALDGDEDTTTQEEDDNPRGWLSEAREVCREHAQDNPQEAYEWWRIDPWLCARFKEIGEIVIDNGYGCWWGRGGTGQSLIMDGVLQRIAANQERD